MPRTFLSRLPAIVLAAVGIAAIGVLALPQLVNTLLLPALLEKAPFARKTARLSTITPFRSEGSLEMAGPEGPALSVPRFEIRYSPGSLRRNMIDSLTMAHCVVHLHRQGGRWILPGLAARSGTAGPADPDALLPLPLGFGPLVLEQCRLVLHDPGRPALHFLVSGRVTPVFRAVPGGHRLNRLAATLTVADDLNAALSVAAEIGEEEISVTGTLEEFTPALPGRTLPEPLQGLQFGSLSAHFDVRLDPRELALRQYQVDGRVEGLHLEKAGLAGGTGPEGTSFTLAGTPERLDYRFRSITLETPVDGRFQVDGTARFEGGGAVTSGTLSGTLGNGAEPASEPSPLSFAYRGKRAADGTLQLSGEGRFSATRPLALPGAAGLSGSGALSFTADLQSDRDQTRATLTVVSPDLALVRDGHETMLSGLELEAHFSRRDGQDSARLQGTVDTLRPGQHDLLLKDLRLDLPLPPGTAAGRSEQGAISGDLLTGRGETLAAAAAVITRQGPDYLTTGKATLLGNPDLRLLFSGQASLQSKTATLAWNLAPVSLAAGTLPALTALPPGVEVSGLVEAEGTVLFDRTLSAQARASLSGGRLEISDSKLVADRIDCTVDLPDLPRLRSSPSQRCSVGTIDLSSLHFSDAALTFRIEDARTLFIEKSRINWSGGTLESGALRLTSSMEEIDTTFYCSRINLGQLLEQFGFKGTEGEGSLNGKLPVRITGNRVEFDDGFLFSTPGTGGIVRFTDTGLIRQGMGQIGEAGYLDYSLKALEDFTYNWTKLTFNSAGEELLLTLELDGKPSGALPFKFDKKGVLVESTQGGGLQYPVRLDVNFRLPLTDIFQVGRSINSIMGERK